MHSEDWFSSVQLLSHFQLFATPWIAALQASLSITNSQSLLKLMSFELVMPSSHLILCRPLLLLSPKTGRAIQKANWFFLCSEINFFPSDLVSCCSIAKSCLTFCDPMDCSTPGSSVHGLLQAKILECCHFLLQGIFTTQGSNPCLLHWQASSLPLSH